MNTINAKQIIREINLTSKATAVFYSLIGYSNTKEECWPSLRTIAKDTNLSVSTVQRALNELLEIGLITKKHNYREDGSQTSNVYRIITAICDRAAAAAENAMLKLHDLRKRMEYIEAAEEKKKQMEVDFSVLQPDTASIATRILHRFSALKEILTTPPVHCEYPRT